MLYAALLDRLREGNHTDEHIELLKSQVISQDNTNKPISTKHLMYNMNEICTTVPFLQEQQQIKYHCQVLFAESSY